MDTSPNSQEPQIPSLVSRIPDGGTQDPDQILDLFLGWVADVGFELYPAQEEALLELMAQDLDPRAQLARLEVERDDLESIR
ncbi:MAG: hypothetical protein AAFX50_23995, partial [Acidobacteriota bacterium]